MNGLAYRRSFDLPRGFAVEFILDGGRLEAQWSPKVPYGKRARQLLPAYREARDEFIGSLGIPALVVEL